MPKLTQEQLLALSRAANFEWETITQYIDTSDWVKILKELGFVEVGGRWVKMIPSYASTVKQSVTTAGEVAGTTATIYETVTSPVSKIIASNTGTKVTTSGILTATSTSVGAAACAGALGFTMGVNWFEASPESWTKLSNIVFGTDLNPSEIGQLARDTNAIVMIKDGICYMAEDLVTAIRNALFEIGAADVNADFGVATTGNIEVSTFGDMSKFWGYVDDYLQTTECVDAETTEWYNRIRKYTGYADVKGRYSNTTGRYVDVFVNHSPQSFTVAAELPQTYGFIKDREYNNTALSATRFDGYTSANNTNVRIMADTRYDGKIRIQRLSYSDRPRSTNVVIGYTKLSDNDFYFGTVNAVDQPSIPGVTPTGEQGTKEQTLDEVFPDWVAKAVTTIGDFPDTVRRWLPLTLPSTQVETQGNPLTTTQAQTGALPEDETEAAAQIQSNTDTKTTTQTGEALSPTPLPIPLPTITPTPGTPSISGGGGSATGLANLYNPTLAQIKQFSRWLWGSDGLNLDQLKKLLQDPMQAIIGLHVMYATPTTGATRDIQVGYINSGVQSKIVTEQYTEIDCGTVKINEYFGDARDYSPYTQVYCYLPFIGIVELNADDVVNSTLAIKYKIDVLTGCCLAQLTVKKYGLDAVLYTYTGNCAVQMPITSGNYLSTVSSLLGAVVSGAAAVATGGALAPVAIGAAANAMGGGARASVAMSGSLGSNAGAMGIRKPYLIIKRVESADANGYNEFYGYPTNKRVNLSQLTGYVRVKEINLSGTNATEDEQNEIVALLKEGVIL